MPSSSHEIARISSLHPCPQMHVHATLILAHKEWAKAMGQVRAHVVIPDTLVEEIDKIAGPRGRSAFLIESAEKEIRRLKLLAFIDDTDAAWQPEEHPEIADAGTAAWVRNLRQRKSTRQLLIEAWAEERNS
jgi:hypothetical protein